MFYVLYDLCTDNSSVDLAGTGELFQWLFGKEVRPVSTFPSGERFRNTSTTALNGSDVSVQHRLYQSEQLLKAVSVVYDFFKMNNHLAEHLKLQP